MNDNTMLNTALAQRLYHDCAQVLPIVDYHNHLAIEDLAENRNYENLTQLWIRNDPYKHRAMRICGVPEQSITGSKDDKALYDTWMQVLPRLLGNPLYDWSILEMQQVFGFNLVPGKSNADSLWEQANDCLQRPEFSARGLLEHFGVEYAAPCASALDDLSPLEGIEHIVPSLRGDDLLFPNKDTIAKLEERTGSAIKSLENYIEVVKGRLDVFATAGCKVADHALDNGFHYYSKGEWSESCFAAVCQGVTIPQKEREALASEILRVLAGEYARRGWLMQLHLGAQRYTSSRLRTLAGPAGGFAGIGSGWDMQALSKMLDDFEQSGGGLPHIVLFPLNPADNAAMAVLSGSFPGDGVTAQVQLGPAWWWCDHRDGMRAVLESVASFGVLSTWIGMTTDSRSPLSFVRHGYFRRVLCSWISEQVKAGALPAAESDLRVLVEAVCCRNAQKILVGG